MKFFKILIILSLIVISYQISAQAESDEETYKSISNNSEIFIFSGEAPVFNYSDYILAHNNETGTNDNSNCNNEIRLRMVKSPAAAWALSFFIPLFIPILGTGQYYADSFASGITTTVLGLASFGTAIYGLITQHNIGLAAIAVYIMTWIFDWNYAIISANRYNDRLLESMESKITVRPHIAFGTDAVNKTIVNRLISVGLSCHF